MKTRTLFIALASLIIASCTSVKKKVENSSPYPDMVQWPEEYLPESAGFFVHNEIDIEASPELVWNILIDAESWPEWYEGARGVNIKDREQLGKDAEFSWETMGLKFTSHIKEFEPNERLSWESVRGDIRGYHAWLIIVDSNSGGCKLVTEESQKGFLTLMEKLFQPRKLERLHQIWLEEIKQKAESANEVTEDSNYN